VVGHCIEHKQIGGIFRLVVIDDHLNALFVHASLSPLHPQEKTAAPLALRSARRFSRLIKAVTPRRTPFDDADGITQFTP
jgi:predicted LPLAT superfamily acyltransferase